MDKDREELGRGHKGIGTRIRRGIGTGRKIDTGTGIRRGQRVAAP